MCDSQGNRGDSLSTGHSWLKSGILALFYYHIVVLTMPFSLAGVIFPFADMDMHHDLKWQVVGKFIPGRSH